VDRVASAHDECTHLLDLHAVRALQLSQAALHQRRQVLVNGLMAGVIQTIVAENRERAVRSETQHMLTLIGF